MLNCRVLGLLSVVFPAALAFNLSLTPSKLRPDISFTFDEPNGSTRTIIIHNILHMHVSNVKVYDGFLSIEHFASLQASPLYLFSGLVSLLFLASIPPGLN